MSPGATGNIECAAHLQTQDPDCEYCEKEMRQNSAYHRGRVESNQAKMNKLKRMGANLEPAAVLDLKLNMLITVLFQDNEKNRLKFEIMYQEELGNFLEQATAEASRRILTQGVENNVRGMKGR